MIRVLVVAPTNGARGSLEQLLEAAGLDVVLAPRDAVASLDALIEQRRPDVVVVEAGAEAQLARPLGLGQTPAPGGAPGLLPPEWRPDQPPPAALPPRA